MTGESGAAAKPMPKTPARPLTSDADRRSRHLQSKSGAGPFWDVDALGRRASERLAQGDFALAFALADRRCRLIVPAARDLFLRAQTHKAAGRLEAAQRDLGAALALDPTDILLDRAALSWGDEASRTRGGGANCRPRNLVLAAAPQGGGGAL